MTHKYRKSKEFSCFEMLDVLFFSMFGHQNAEFGTGSGSAIRKNAGSGSVLNQCGSTTLVGGFIENGLFFICRKRHRDHPAAG
jgi:hypothetical protein